MRQYVRGSIRRYQSVSCSSGAISPSVARPALSIRQLLVQRGFMVASDEQDSDGIKIESRCCQVVIGLWREFLSNDKPTRLAS